ncbi:MAG: potassium-transporting ATPase subunit C [Nitrososphaeraceae archaeon]
MGNVRGLARRFKIAQEFTSDKFFHSRPVMNSTSGVDPHITPEDAFSQVPRISRATGLEVNTLKTIIQNGVSKNLPRTLR